MSEDPGTRLFNPSQIQQAVDGMAQEIAAWLTQRQARALNLVSILEGARPLTRDLVGRLEKLIPQIELKIQGVRIKGTDGTILLKERQRLEGWSDPEALRFHPNLLVDDLVDSGLTLQTLKTEVHALGAKEVKTAVLLRKFGEASGPVDFCGFDLNLSREALARKGLKDYWLFGYGMDLDGRQRELEHIGWMEIR